MIKFCLKLKIFSSVFVNFVDFLKDYNDSAYARYQILLFLLFPFMSIESS